VGVFVGGMLVAVEVLVGGGVAVGTDVPVAGTVVVAVLVAETDVGGAVVLVGGIAVDVAVGTSVAVGTGVFVGIGVKVGVGTGVSVGIGVSVGGTSVGVGSTVGASSVTRIWTGADVSGVCAARTSVPNGSTLLTSTSITPSVIRTTIRHRRMRSDRFPNPVIHHAPDPAAYVLPHVHSTRMTNLHTPERTPNATDGEHARRSRSEGSAPGVDGSPLYGR